MTKEEILKKSFDAMPDGIVFTGYDYAESCAINGLNKLLNSESVIKNARANYLKKHCKRISRKSYIKKNAIKKTIIEAQQSTLNFEIGNAIALLKSKGYRIQKIVTNYEEI